MGQETWTAKFSNWVVEGGLGKFTLPGPFLVQLKRDGGGGKKKVDDQSTITAYVHMGGCPDNWKVLDKKIKGVKDFNHMSSTINGIFGKQETEWRKSN